MTWISLLAITLIIIQWLHLSLGFSAWLPCHRSLEEDEVIMNNKVVEAPADTTDDTVVALAIYDSSGHNRLDVDSIVWIDEEVAASLRSIQFTVRMDPSTTDALSDIQYVVEAYPFEDDTPVAPSPPTHRVSSAPSPHTAPMEGLKAGFIAASRGGGVLCGGKRSHTRGKTGFVTYELNLNDMKKRGREGALSSMWGGWAEGHSKVTLTPRIFFKIRSTPGDDNKDEL